MPSSQDHSQKTKTASLAFWMGFSDELQKIAAPTPALVQNARQAKTGLPKLTSKPVVKEPDPPASILDPLRSSKTAQPPPVTTGF